MTTSSFFTGVPVVSSLTMRRLPPAGGAIRLMVRPARSSPLAKTVSFSGPRTTLAVGTDERFSGSTVPAMVKVAATATTAMSAAIQIRRFFIVLGLAFTLFL